MPYVNIRIAGTLSHEQRKQIAAEVTSTLERVVLKPKSSIYISFDEVPRENWAVGGELLGKKE
jgi:4-oxalocrotonate tautomerase